MPALDQYSVLIKEKVAMWNRTYLTFNIWWNKKSFYNDVEKTFPPEKTIWSINLYYGMVDRAVFYNSMLMLLFCVFFLRDRVLLLPPELIQESQPPSGVVQLLLCLYCNLYVWWMLAIGGGTIDSDPIASPSDPHLTISFPAWALQSNAVVHTYLYQWPVTLIYKTQTNVSTTQSLEYWHAVGE